MPRARDGPASRRRISDADHPRDSRNRVPAALCLAARQTLMRSPSTCADEAKAREDDGLPRLESLAVGVGEEIGEFLVHLDHRQEPREACTEAPEQVSVGNTRCRCGPPQDNRASERDTEHPIRDPECVAAIP